MDEQTRHYLLGALLLVLGFVLGRLSAGGRRPSQPPSSFTRPIAPPQDGIDPDSEAQLLALLQAGKLIEAIKRHRQLYGSDLRTAKQAVEALARQHGIRV